MVPAHGTWQGSSALEGNTHSSWASFSPFGWVRVSCFYAGPARNRTEIYWQACAHTHRYSDTHMREMENCKKKKLKKKMNPALSLPQPTHQPSWDEWVCFLDRPIFSVVKTATPITLISCFFPPQCPACRILLYVSVGSAGVVYVSIHLPLLSY